MGYIILLGTAAVMYGLVAMNLVHKYQSLKNRGKYAVGIITYGGTDASYEWQLNGKKYGGSNYYERRLKKGEKYLVLYDPKLLGRASLLIHRPILSAQDTIGLDTMKVREEDLVWRLM